MDAETTKIRISQIPPYDGEYEILDSAFSTKEWRWLKQISGGEIRPATLGDGDTLSDPDFIIGLAVIAMRRAGKITAEQVLEVADTLSEAPLDDAHLSLILPEVKEDELPLALTSEREPASLTDSLENKPSTLPSNGNSGNDSKNASAPSEMSLERTGTTRSDTSFI